MAEVEVSRDDFILIVTILGCVSGLLLLLVIGLCIWNVNLSKKIKKLDPLANFKIQRPKLIHDNNVLQSSHSYDNPMVFKNENGINNGQTKTDLNPIALRSKASFDNGNFIFGNPNNRSSNSYTDYIEQDSRFY